ncbi:unnamed protein product [Notodromas monacha]|uniref:Uncharacterized protein n=1 Tax=Notodromas monacha TaxID=399045 RepID=A0A7R9G8P7_9CRUS|nr:unnamed protein product [Notodromas monacha]CAG0912318.1 unnamed protein product [Notodromas monacha]
MGTAPTQARIPPAIGDTRRATCGGPTALRRGNFGLYPASLFSRCKCFLGSAWTPSGRAGRELERANLLTSTSGHFCALFLVSPRGREEKRMAVFAVLEKLRILTIFVLEMCRNSTCSPSASDGIQDKKRMSRRHSPSVVLENAPHKPGHWLHDKRYVSRLECRSPPVTSNNSSGTRCPVVVPMEAGASLERVIIRLHGSVRNHAAPVWTE